MATTPVKLIEILKPVIDDHVLLEQIDEDYPFFMRYGYSVIRMFNEFRQSEFLNEFVNTTLSPVDTKRIIEKDYHGKVKITPGGPTPSKLRTDVIDFIWVEYSSNDLNIFNPINNRLDAFGWYAGVFKDNKVFDSGSIPSMTPPIVVKYESKHDVEIPISQDFLYHACPDFMYSKIQRFGLTPRSYSKLIKHPDRIYLLLDDHEDHFEDISLRLLSATSNKYLKAKSVEYFILRIDLKKIREVEDERKLLPEKRMKFFKDPNMPEDAVWTPGNISPKRIEKIGSYEVNPMPSKDPPDYDERQRLKNSE